MDVKTRNDEQEESHMEKTRQALKPKCGCLIPSFCVSWRLDWNTTSSASHVHPEVSTVESALPCTVLWAIQLFSFSYN